MGEGGLGTAHRKQQNCNSFSTLHHFLMVSFTRIVDCVRNHVPVSTLFTACGCVCFKRVVLCVPSVLLCAFQAGGCACFIRVAVCV